MTRYVKGVSIYKPAKRRRRTDPYLMAYHEDAGGKRVRRTETGSTDLQITIAAANRIALRNDAARLGIVDANAGRYARNEAKPVTKHVDDYRDALLARKKTTKHADDTAAMCRRVFAAAGIERLGDISESDVQKAIANLTPLRRIAHERLSLRQLDKAVRAVKAFAHWLKQDKRTPTHLLADLHHYDPEQDRRRIRRVVSEADILNLLEVTRGRKKLGGLTGADRAMLYALAVGTGFRFSTLCSLKPSDFDLSGSPSLVNVEARNTKGRRRIEHPIRDDLAAVLRAWLPTREPGKALFPAGQRFNDTFQRDLRAAGIPERDASGHVFDFHAQRNQYITAVVRAAGLAVAQDLAHHSTPVLTKRYARMSYDDYGKALAALPGLSAPGQRAKGRDPKTPGNNRRVG